MSEHTHYVVIEDPENQYFEGSLVEAQRAAQLEARGVALLPVVPELLKRSGAGGYAKRCWGSGWALDYPYPKMSAQMALFGDPLHKALHWKARLVASEEFLAKDVSARTGQLSIAADSSQRTPHHAGITPGGKMIEARSLPNDLGRKGECPGWIIGGQATVACPMEGHYGYAIYGYAPGLRVLWAAVSVTMEKSQR